MNTIMAGSTYYKRSSSLSVLLSLVCSISLVQSLNGGVTTDLFHRDSPLLPSYDPSKTHFERLRSAFQRSFSRKSSLLSKATVQAPITSNGGEYLLKFQIGTPPVEQLGIADTGSDLTWVQCQPCTECYKQTSPLFDPSKTTSYRAVSCDSQKCSTSGSVASCGDNNVCQYQVSYGDQSSSTGDLAAETLTLGSGVSFPKVIFGCGHQNEGTFSQSGSGSGLVGLGGGSVSIINQLGTSTGGRFSYCLTPVGSNVSSKISFGSEAVVAGPDVVSTPLVKKSPDTFYYLTLQGVSVGTERFEYEALSEEGNIIIDSGTTLTFVPSEVYSGIESALVKAINGTRQSDSQGTFNLCYEAGSGFSWPPITAHFEGADWVLPQGSTFLEVEQGLVCLTLLPSQDLAIFGNLNQINYHVGYDLVKQQLNFLPTDCSRPQ